MKKRVFIDAKMECRCTWTITLKDGSQAQCGRRSKTDDRLCNQHAKMKAKK